MSEIDFYTAPQTRAMTGHWMPEVVGVPYRMDVLHFKKGEHKQPAHLAINAIGPAVDDGAGDGPAAATAAMTARHEH
jgi:hypothetical protein